MQCPACESYDVVRLPPNAISPKPGYRCGACGLRMRNPGMTVVYLVTLVLGAALGGFMLWGTVNLESPRVVQTAGLAVAGMVAAGYSFWQIMRSVPRRDPPRTSESDRWPPPDR